MKRLITILFILIALPCFAANWQVTVKIEKPGSEHADSLKAHIVQRDSVREDVQDIIEPLDLGLMTVSNDEGTQYIVTAPDTIPIIGSIRSALGKYNRRVTLRKERIEELE